MPLHYPWPPSSQPPYPPSSPPPHNTNYLLSIPRPASWTACPRTPIWARSRTPTGTASLRLAGSSGRTAEWKRRIAGRDRFGTRRLERFVCSFKGFGVRMIKSIRRGRQLLRRLGNRLKRFREMIRNRIGIVKVLTCFWKFILNLHFFI